MTLGRLRTLSLGEGPAVVILHGYAMRPETYLPLAQLLAGRVRVLVPALFEMDGPWRYRGALDALAATLDGLGVDRVSLLGHSRDSLLARSSGEEFARRLRASFTVAAEQGVDHDWMFDDPELFAGQLSGLGLRAFGGAGRPVGPPRRRRPGASPPPGRGSPRAGGRAGAGYRAPRRRPG